MSLNATASGIDLLLTAGKWLSDPQHWCQQAYAMQGNVEVDTVAEIMEADKCCAEGALIKFGGKGMAFWQAGYWLDWSAGFAMPGNRSVHQINDEGTHEEVMDLYRKAIRRAKQQHKELYHKDYVQGQASEPD